MLPQLIGRQIALNTPVQHGACAELLKRQKVVTSETLGPGSVGPYYQEKERKPGIRGMSLAFSKKGMRRIDFLTRK